MAQPKLREMMGRLIGAASISSVSPEWDSSNETVIDLLADWCEARGFAIERQAIPGHPGKFNLVASIGRGPDGLVLSGHTDTVPCDEALWHSDPFRLDERDDRWYGLGSCDMKGFFAVVLDALDGLELEKLQRPLVLVATADEESSMSGAKALLETHRGLGRHAVIGEPTGLRPVRLHKGILMDAVRVVGQSGHSSDPALGNSALEGMHQVIGELLAWRDDLQARYRNPLFAVDVPTLNLGHICGGDNPNRICGACELSFDLRPLPGMDSDALRGELDRRLASRLADSGLEVERKALFEGIPAMETPADAPIVAAAERLTGFSAGAVAFATEGPYLNAMGHQTVILGPGSINQAHQPNEYLALDQVAPARRIIRSLIDTFCMSA
ncbi:MAG: acetylornithine deacetylase [Chromatiaceae bacterium]|jgi:acetylornithine deacetylase